MFSAHYVLFTYFWPILSHYSYFSPFFLPCAVLTWPIPPFHQLLSFKLAALSQQEDAGAGPSALAYPGAPTAGQPKGPDAMALGEAPHSFSALLRNEGELGDAELLGEGGGGAGEGLASLSRSLQSSFEEPEGTTQPALAKRGRAAG